MNTQSFALRGPTQTLSQTDPRGEFTDFSTQAPAYGDYPHFASFSQVSALIHYELRPSTVNQLRSKLVMV